MNNVENIKFEKNGDLIEGVIVTFKKDNQTFRKRISLYDSRLPNILINEKEKLEKELSKYASKNKFFHALEKLENISIFVSTIAIVPILIIMFLVVKPPLYILVPYFTFFVSHFCKVIGLDEEALEKEINTNNKINDIDSVINSFTKQNNKEMDYREPVKMEEVSNLKIFERTLKKIFNKSEDLILIAKSFIGEAIYEIKEDIREDKRYREEEKKRLARQKWEYESQKIKAQMIREKNKNRDEINEGLRRLENISQSNQRNRNNYHENNCGFGGRR